MNIPRRRKILWVLAIAVFLGAVVQAQDLEQIGVTLLRATTTNVDGSGIRVAQPEAGSDPSEQYTNWEVNPANSQVRQPSSLFTYISADGSTTNYPNFLSSESGHADTVAGFFYGMSGGVATNAAHVDNYDANYFVQVSETPIGPVTNYSASLSANADDSVVNQSFIFYDFDTNNKPVSVPVGEQQAVDSAYDDFAAQHNVLFVSGAGNGSPPRVCPPATCYNGIGVGAYTNSTSYNSVGPTIDNGRCKPDITALSDVTSFSTPQVAGAAALLLQAGLRGDGGGDTNSAADIRTVKSLLLNGAIKPAGWTNSNSSPLDARYGAGVLNVFNSYEQLAGGKHDFIDSTSVDSGSAHPPTGDSGTVGALSGWDFNSISSSAGGLFSSATDGVNHYYFNVTNGSGNAAFTLTATLVWNRQLNQTNINDLDLFLFDAANSNLVACSTSRVDNVEHIWLPRLPQGRYNLQVLKNAGNNTVSDSETYALAFEFFAEPLQIAQVETNAAFSWPVYPAGFTLESTTNLASSIGWTTNNIPPPVVTNNQNYILLNATNPAQFFRLRRP